MAVLERHPALRTYLAPLVLAALALGSAWYLLHLDTGEFDLGEATKGLPDFFVEQFTTTTMDDQGRPKRRLEAQYMAHFPDTGTTELQQPYLVLYDPGKPPWHVRSERGWVSPDNSLMLLLGEVHIWRNTRDGEPNLEIDTEDLRVFPEERIGETEQPVVISTPRSRTHSMGMRAYMEQNRLELLSQVRTVVEPDTAAP